MQKKLQHRFDNHMMAECDGSNKCVETRPRRFSLFKTFVVKVPSFDTHFASSEQCWWHCFPRVTSVTASPPSPSPHDRRSVPNFGCLPLGLTLAPNKLYRLTNPFLVHGQ